jgi:C_GCAxxG_C_C family probable redox protein
MFDQLTEDKMISDRQDLLSENHPSPVSQKAIELLKECGNCAQTSFAILNEEHNLEGDQILKALTPFPGIALRGETCGAVTGSLMALGLVYGRDHLTDWNAYIRSLPPARKFCARFEERYGSTSCSDILQEKMGQTYDLADKAEALHYAVSGGPEACAEVVAYAVEIASESITKARR